MSSHRSSLYGGLRQLLPPPARGPRQERVQRQQPLPHVLQIRATAVVGSVLRMMMMMMMMRVVVLPRPRRHPRRHRRRRRRQAIPSSQSSYDVPRDRKAGVVLPHAPPRPRPATTAVPPRSEEHVGQEVSLLEPGGGVQQGVAAARSRSVGVTGGGGGGGGSPHSHEQAVAQASAAAQDALGFGHFCLEAGGVMTLDGELAVKLGGRRCCRCWNSLGSRHHVDEVAVLHLVRAQGLRVGEDFSSIDQPLPRLGVDWW